MSRESRLTAGVLLILLPTVEFDGVSLLTLLINQPSYSQNELRQDLWRAGHAHAGVLLILSLVVLRYVDDAHLGVGARWFVRLAFPGAAILLPLAFFLSVLTPDATQPNGLINLAYLGAALLAAGLIVLGIGLVRARGAGAQATTSGARRPEYRANGGAGEGDVTCAAPLASVVAGRPEAVRPAAPAALPRAAVLQAPHRPPWA